ncbi:UNVERIFIED_CONTAM: hypothetical protein GTU68_021430 [Idotea baltica]|nr:hypothetical protein [Idotea baltica]
MKSVSFSASEDDEGLRLDSFLTKHDVTLSRSRAKALVKEGAATRNGEVTTDPRRAVEPGETYTLTKPEPVAAIPQAENIPLDVLFEDADLIILNKPSGMAVHPAPGSWTGTLVNALLHHCHGQLPGIGGVERPGIVHRIDKLTTGVMVAAKTEAAHVGLSAMFADHSMERAYLAVTRGAPRPLKGTVNAPIARSTSDRKKMAVPRNPEARETFGLLEKGSGLPAAALIECRLETGRTHQIRVHLSHIGAPLGIKAYGHGPAYDSGMAAARAFPRQALHAATLGFEHPITKEALRFEAPLPEDMVGLIDAVRAMPKPGIG